jgi:hypothetical protein
MALVGITIGGGLAMLLSESLTDFVYGLRAQDDIRSPGRPC